MCGRPPAVSAADVLGAVCGLYSRPPSRLRCAHHSGLVKSRGHPMSILRRLFARPASPATATPARTPRTAPGFPRREGFLWDIATRRLSPSREWAVDFRDWSEGGLGRLMNRSGAVFHLAEVERPQAAFVTDDGHVLVFDWLHKQGGRLGSAALFFGPTGQLVHRHDVTANWNADTARRRQGTATVQTWGSRTPDGESLFTFSLVDGSLSAQRPLRRSEYR